MKVIDFHVHPFVKEVIEKEKLAKAVIDFFHLRNAPEPLETLFSIMEIADIEKAVLLPINCETQGVKLPSNKAVSDLAKNYPDKFIGFGSVDPNKKDAKKDLEIAVNSLKLRGIKLNPYLQNFNPLDEKVFPLYKCAEDFGVPILFHSGMFWHTSRPLSCSHPLLFDKIAIKFPELTIILAHFGFPWIWDASVLAMRHPNVYLDLSNVFTSNIQDYYESILIRRIGKRTIESSLEKKILFGSDFPRIEPNKLVEAVQKLPLQEKTKKRILYENAKKLLKV
jgi:hypothetical protein